MGKVHFINNQILAILKQTERGVPLPGLCHEHRKGNSTFLNDALNMLACMGPPPHYGLCLYLDLPSFGFSDC